MLKAHWTRIVLVGAALMVGAGCGRERPENQVRERPTTRPAIPVAQRRSVLPDNRTIDSLQWVFCPALLDDPAAKLPLLGGPSAGLGITRGGTVYYYYTSEPHTGSGGRTAHKEWKIPPQEAEALLDALVADGVLELPDAGVGKGHGITAGYGRWQIRYAPEAMPRKIVARLMPYVEKGMGGMKW